MNHCLNFLYHFMVSSLKLWHVPPTLLPTHFLCIGAYFWVEIFDLIPIVFWVKMDDLRKSHFFCIYTTYAFTYPLSHTIRTKLKFDLIFVQIGSFFLGQNWIVSEDTCYGNITGSKLSYIWKIWGSKHFKHQGFSVSTYTI